MWESERSSEDDQRFSEFSRDTSPDSDPTHSMDLEEGKTELSTRLEAVSSGSITPVVSHRHRSELGNGDAEEHSKLPANPAAGVLPRFLQSDEEDDSDSGSGTSLIEADDAVTSLRYICATNHHPPLPEPRPELENVATARNVFGFRRSKLHVVDTPQRISKTIDLETGREGMRAQCALIRDEDERQPQMRRRRLKRRAEKAVKESRFWSFGKKKEEDDGDDDNGKAKHDKRGHLTTGTHRLSMAHIPIDDGTQYRLVSVNAATGQEDAGGNFGAFSQALYSEITEDDDKGCGCLGFKPNQLVISYLFWAFRSNFLPLFISAALWFFTLTTLFALVLYGFGMNDPTCLHVNGQDFDSEGGANFMDAYALSWTTFSTVGYGLVYPSTTATAEHARHCMWITIICTWESFCGILIASFWGAIFLSKVSRVSSFAQVTFSDPILIRYGYGLGSDAKKKSGGVFDELDEEEDSDSDDDEGDDRALQPGSASFDPDMNEPKVPRRLLSKVQCPIMEFRVLNRLQTQKRGEIIDASMNIVASINKDQIVRKESTARNIKKRGRKKGGKRLLVEGSIRQLLDEDLPTLKEWRVAESKVNELLRTHNRRPSRFGAAAGDELDVIGSLESKKVFAKLFIESQEHPFFKRIWVGRHILDQDSPLLKQSVKDLIRLNNGHWPTMLNSPEAVRASVQFDQVLVSLSGTSNADCSSVYAQKVYDYVDLCVGYKFVNALYRNASGFLLVDENLLNDVVEQNGGGGENLEERSKINSTEGQIFIL